MPTQVRSIALQLFGRVLAGGVFTSYDNSLRFNIVRLFDGSASFQNLSARAHAIYWRTNPRSLGSSLEGNWNKIGLDPGALAVHRWPGLGIPKSDWLIRRFPLFDHTRLPLIAANVTGKARNKRKSRRQDWPHRMISKRQFWPLCSPGATLALAFHPG